MNKTTVKRGIGAVLLALVAAGLLAYLLKDKADQRQDIVDMPLPGSDTVAHTVDVDGKLPQLSTDNNSGNAVNGSIVASANAKNAAEGAVDSATGAIAAVGDGVSGAIEGALDFTVRPTSTKSDDFKELSDVNFVNNGNGSKDKAAGTSSSTKENTDVEKLSQTNGTSAPKSSQGTVIASTPARTNTGSARLVGERKTVAPRSSRTETVVTRKAAPSTKTVAQQKAPAPVSNSETSSTGYAIQLLATSSISRAKNLVDVMRKEGYSAYFTKVTQNGKLLYRVRIGQYASSAEANKAHQAMKRRYKKNPDVNRSAVVRR